MLSNSEWIVSSLCDDDDDQALPPATTPLIPTHLFLHFDINETILLGDDAGGDSRNESAHKMLAKSAFCRIPAKSSSSWEKTQELKPTHWWDGQEIGRETSMPPLYTGWEWPENCCPYYRTAHKRYAKSFAEDGVHGQVYAPLLEACEASLKSSSSQAQQTGQNTILPAFYETLRHLIESHQKNEANNHVDANENNNNTKESQPPPFTVIFRTFGSDLSDIAKVVTAFAKGDHPDYPDIDFPPLCLSEDRLYQGRWKVIENTDHDVDSNESPETKVIYQLWTSDESELVASGDSEILELLSGKRKVNNDESSPSSPSPFSVFGIRDDYPFWKANEYLPTAGKPIWVCNYENHGAEHEDGRTSHSHHLFFDDNIHNLPDDGIACVRKESSQGNAVSNESSSRFETVDGKDLNKYQGTHLIRVPTVEPVLNPQWYIQQIEKARNRFQLQLQSQVQS